MVTLVSLGTVVLMVSGALAVAVTATPSLGAGQALPTGTLGHLSFHGEREHAVHARIQGHSNAPLVKLRSQKDRNLPLLPHNQEAVKVTTSKAVISGALVVQENLSSTKHRKIP